MRAIKDTVNFGRIPVTVDLNVQPLKMEGQPVTNGNGEVIMNDDWIYTHCKGYGDIAINVNRSNYCKKVYLSNVKIADSFNGEMTDRLKRFIEEVADTLVFKKNGVSYRVYLKETGEGKKMMDIAKVSHYWATVGTGGIMHPWSSVKKIYKSDVDLKETFNF